jgi:hypothetical protein
MQIKNRIIEDNTIHIHHIDGKPNFAMKTNALTIWEKIFLKPFIHITDDGTHIFKTEIDWFRLFHPLAWMRVIYATWIRPFFQY